MLTCTGRDQLMVELLLPSPMSCMRTLLLTSSHLPAAQLHTCVCDTTPGYTTNTSPFGCGCLPWGCSMPVPATPRHATPSRGPSDQLSKANRCRRRTHSIPWHKANLNERVASRGSRIACPLLASPALHLLGQTAGLLNADEVGWLVGFPVIYSDRPKNRNKPARQTYTTHTLARHDTAR